jgi:Domain of unknown function (DUF4276)
MSLKIVCVVEGQGEVSALPILIRRMLACANVVDYVDIPTPIRTRRDRFLRVEEEYRKVLGLAAAKAGGNPILVLLDADDDCPVDISGRIRRIVQTTIEHSSVGIVIADREFESWFLASAPTLSGNRTLSENLHVPEHSETIRNCKGWLSERMASKKYSEVLDQPAFANRICPSMASQHSRSFKKFSKEVTRLLGLSNHLNELA